MTMVDEEVLSRIIGDAAAMIEIPEGAAEGILVASRSAEPRTRTRRPRPAFTSGTRGRRILVAAVVIMVLGGVSLSLVASRPGPTGTSDASSAGAERGTSSSGLAAPAHPSAAPFAPPGAAGGAPATSVPPLPPGSVGQSARVEANGSISLTVGDGKLQSVLATLSDLAAGKGGFVASSQAQVGDGGSGTPSSGTIVLRVPEASFGAVVSEVQRIGHATSVTTTSTDVIRAVRGSSGPYRRAPGQPAAVPHDHGPCDLDR